MSLPRTLAEDTLGRIQKRFGLAEAHGPGGGPLMTLTSPAVPGGTAGHVRMLSGGSLDRVVSVSLVAPPFGLDSHMIFAFTPRDCAVPHFTLDAVQAGPHYAFHLDLIPRADLGANLAYMDHVYLSLTEQHQAVAKWPGVTPAHLSPRQNALMSPWMLAYRADEAAFTRLSDPVGRYLEHWFALVSNGIPSHVLPDVDGAALARRDAQNRAAIFNPEVDPVWSRVDRLIGADTSARIRELLRG